MKAMIKIKRHDGHDMAVGLAEDMALPKMPPGMCAIFDRDRLDHRPGCTPSSPETEPIFSAIKKGCYFFSNSQGAGKHFSRKRTIFLRWRSVARSSSLIVNNVGL